VRPGLRAQSHPKAVRRTLRHRAATSRFSYAAVNRSDTQTFYNGDYPLM
jgi:hypothetical protein